MNLFKVEKRFSEKTGKEIRPIPTLTAFICDYCGEKIPTDDPEIEPTSLEIIESGDYEPPFNEMKLGLSYDVYDLMNDHREFRYCTHGLKCCTLLLVERWLKERKDEKQHGRAGRLGQYGDLASAMYQARIDILNKLLSAGQYKLEDFCLIPIK